MTPFSEKHYWYKRFRAGSYVCILASLVSTVLIVLPFRPFSSLPPILEGGGPGVWFLIAYILLLTLGVGGLGMLSGNIATIELTESRIINPVLMVAGFTLLCVGFAGTFALLAIGGITGGYAADILGQSGPVISHKLEPFVYPITGTALAAVVGAATTLVAMIRAR